MNNGRASELIFRVNLRSFLDEQTGQVASAFARGQHQRCRTFLVSQIYIRAFIQKQLRDLYWRFPYLDEIHQSSIPAIVRSIDLGATFQEQSHDLWPREKSTGFRHYLRHRIMQSRLAVVVYPPHM